MPFSAFPLSHTERIAIAIQDLLLADANFSAWLGVRVFRPPDPLMEPDQQLPYALVQIIDEEYPPKISDRTSVTVSIVTIFVYEDARDVAGPAEQTAYSLAHDFTRLLQQTQNNRSLKVARYSNQPLVDQIIQFQTIPFDATLKPQVAHDRGDGDDLLGIEPIDLVRYLPVGVRYRYDLDRTTWTKQAFTP